MEKLVIKYLDRIDKILSKSLNLSRSEVKQMFTEKRVFLNKRPLKPSEICQIGDEINFSRLEIKELDLEPLAARIEILYEDKNLLIIDKPEGLVVHPGAKNFNNTLVNILLSYKQKLSTINGVLRPGIVHRLDKTTSGVLAICKNDFSHQFLQDQFKTRNVKREYIALCEGVILEEEGEINAPIKRSDKNRLIMEVKRGGKEAITHFIVLERFHKFTLLKLTLITGRTHQIRAHLAFIKHPVVGDEKYGASMKAPRIMLHASKIGFINPDSKTYQEVDSPLPSAIKRFLEAIKNVP